MKTNKGKKDFGKGIRALLQNMNEASQPDPLLDAVSGTPDLAAATPTSVAPPEYTANISLERIELNPFQPRKTFDPEALQELAASIRTHGVVQPITVRQLDGEHYQLISGERRLRAAQMAGLQEIPAFVRRANDQEMLEIALIENIQREDLNAIEIALTYQRLLDECSLTHEVLAERLGKQRSTVTNYLRLLRLPPEVQIGLKQQQISMGHARAMLATDDVAIQLVVYKEILEKDLSVRRVEDLMKALIKTYHGTSRDKANARKNNLPYAYQKIMNDLSQRFETKVQLRLKSEGKGELLIPFNSDDDLNRILQAIEL